MIKGFILIGILLFVVVMLPLILIRDYRQKKKLRQILEAYRINDKHESLRKEKETQGDQAKLEASMELEGHAEPEGQAEPEGWGMNNSPFRDRKSGLSWGGGNVKASEATRGTKRKFLRK